MTMKNDLTRIELKTRVGLTKIAWSGLAQIELRLVYSILMIEILAYSYIS